MLTTISAFSCVLPAIAGIFYFKRMDDKFRPFIYAIFLSVLTETTVFILSRTFEAWLIITIVGNIYYIANVTFYLLFFKKTEVISKQVFLALLSICLFTLFGIILFYYPSFKLLLSATVVYDTILLALSVNLLSKQVFVLNNPSYKNALFIISSMLLVYSAFSIFVNIIYLTNGKNEFNKFIFSIHQYINIATYSIYSWAIYCIPKKQKVI